MIKYTKFVAKNPQLWLHGLRGMNKQALTPGLLRLLMQYLTRSKLVKLAPWKKKACVAAGYPIEFVLAFDMFPYHPEAYAAFTGSAEVTQPAIEAAESAGYGRDLCSYMKTSLGARMLDWPEDYGGFGHADFWGATNMVCDTHVKWFENEAKRTGVPFFGLDVPSFVSGEGEERLEEFVDYVVAQYHDMIRVLEQVNHKRFDQRKFLRVIEKTKEITRLYEELYQYRTMYPAVQYFEFQRNLMSPMSIQWNLDATIKYYRRLLSRAKKKYAAVDGRGDPAEREKYRVMWEGITLWYKVEFYSKLLAGHGARVVYEPYTWAFANRHKPGLGFDEALREMAREQILTSYTYNLDLRIEYFSRVIEEYDLDGVILHANFSCRPSATGMQDVKQALQEKFGIPVLMLHCDMNDPRAYADGPIKTRVDGFVELMESYQRRRLGRGSVARVANGDVA